jgi:hypothetical protein
VDASSPGPQSPRVSGSDLVAQVMAGLLAADRLPVDVLSPIAEVHLRADTAAIVAVVVTLARAVLRIAEPDQLFLRLTSDESNRAVLGLEWSGVSISRKEAEVLAASPVAVGTGAGDSSVAAVLARHAGQLQIGEDVPGGLAFARVYLPLVPPAPAFGY